MYKLILLPAILFNITNASASSAKLTGLGIDGKPCMVEVNTSSGRLLGVKLAGATKEWTIIAERGGGYGPSSIVTTNGAANMFVNVTGNPAILGYFQRSTWFSSEGETFSLSSTDLPIDIGLPGGRMNWKLELGYDKKRLNSVRATVDFKVAIVAPVATKEFVCQPKN